MLDLDEELPPRVLPYGSKSHPMFQQWLRMLDSCTDPMHPLYAQVGAKGITVMHRWFDFTNFVEDNEHLYDNEPSRPGNLRKAFISRANLKVGFNPKNLVWVKKKEAMTIQPKTICVDTIHGKNMPLKALVEFLRDHDGEDLPDGAKIYKHWVKRWNPATGKIQRVYVPLTTIQAIKISELRRRHKAGLDLLAPVREYGTDKLEEELETEACAELDRNRKPIPNDAPYYVKNRGYA